MSVLMGIGISAACLGVWLGSLALARRGGGRRFLAAHLGGMLVRLALAGGLSAWSLAGERVRPVPFLIALIGSYLLLMAAEVGWAMRRRQSGHPAA